MAERPESIREWVRNHDERWLFVLAYLGLAVGLSVMVSLFWLVVVAGVHFLFEVIRQAHYRDGRMNVVLHAMWEVKLDAGLVLLALVLVLYVDIVLGVLGLQSAARAGAVARAGARIGTRAAAWERTLRTILLTMDEAVRIVYAAVLLRRRTKRGTRSADDASPSAGEGGQRDAPSGAALTAPASRPEPVTTPVDEGRDRAGAAAPADGNVMARTHAGRTSHRDDAEEQALPGRAPGSAGYSRPADRPGPHAGPPPPADGAAPDAVTPPAPAAAGSTDMPAWRSGWGAADRIAIALIVIGLGLILFAPYLTSHDWASVGEALRAELRPFPSD
jgi:hypothetical protein